MLDHKIFGKMFSGRRAAAMALAVTFALSLPFGAGAAEGFFDWAQEEDGEGVETERKEINLDEQITLDFAYGVMHEDYMTAFDGADVRLRVTGFDYLPFLTSCNFGSVELDIADDDSTLFQSEDEGDLRAGDIKGLKSLAYTDRANRDPELPGTFPELEHMTVRLFGGDISYLGRMRPDQLPALKTLRVEYEDESAIRDANLPRGMIFPDTIESVEVYCGDEMVPEDGNWSSRLLGGLAVCCPDARVNGLEISQLKETAHVEDSGDEESDFAHEFDIARADSTLYAMYKSVKEGTAPYSASEAPHGNSTIFVTIEDDQIGQSSLDETEEDGYFKDVPEEILASGIDDAQTAVIVEEDLTLVGYYYMGNAYRTTTNLMVMNTETGELYSSDTIAVNDPPETIEVTTINGIQTPKSGWGEFEIQNALDTALAKIGPVGGEDGNTASGSGTDGDGQNDGSGSGDKPAVPDEAMINRVLNVLEGGSGVYRKTRSLLKSGEKVTSGSRGDAASGVQQLLADLGCEITVDGAAGQQTLGALHRVQQEMGMPVTDEADITLFDTLLPMLLVIRDVKGETGSAAGTDTDADMNTDTDADAGMNTGIYTGAVLDTGIDKDIAIKTDPVFAIGMDTGDDPGLETDTEAGPGTEDDMETEADVLWDLQNFYEESEGPGYYTYLQGCAYALQGRYYAAKEIFETCDYKDSAARAESCVQEWPGTGEVWHNPNVGGSDVSLTFTVNSTGAAKGTCFYMYTDTGVMTSAVLVTGSDSATTYVPAGTYRIKAGAGDEWYGKTDAFGREGVYQFMSFGDEEDMENYDPSARYKAELQPGSYELTINASEVSEDSTGVGETDVDWDSWVG